MPAFVVVVQASGGAVEGRANNGKVLVSKFGEDRVGGREKVLPFLRRKRTKRRRSGSRGGSGGSRGDEGRVDLDVR